MRSSPGEPSRPHPRLPLELDPGEVLEAWSSRTARFVRLRPEGTDGSLVLKYGAGWTEADSKSVYEAHLNWGAALKEANGVRGLQALSWFSNPAAVALEHIEGVDLDHWLMTAPDKRVVDEVLSRCGRALGLLHRANSGTRTDGMVVTAGDFAPYNVRVVEDGTLVVLDPHSDAGVVCRLRDVAWFLLWARRARPVGDVADLQGPFLAGYASVDGTDPISEVDEHLLHRLLGRYGLVATLRCIRRRRWRTAIRVFLRTSSDFLTGWRGGWRRFPRRS